MSVLSYIHRLMHTLITKNRTLSQISPVQPALISESEIPPDLVSWFLQSSIPHPPLCSKPYMVLFRTAWAMLQWCHMCHMTVHTICIQMWLTFLSVCLFYLCKVSVLYDIVWSTSCPLWQREASHSGGGRPSWSAGNVCKSLVGGRPVDGSTCIMGLPEDGC